MLLGKITWSQQIKVQKKLFNHPAPFLGGFFFAFISMELTDDELKKLLDSIAGEKSGMSPEQPNYAIWDKLRDELAERQEKQWSENM